MADLGDDNCATDPVAPLKKRSLFSKAAKERASEADEAVEFFSRAKEIYPQRLAEEERRRQRKIMKLERKRCSTSADRKELTPPERKKRRVSSQMESKDGHSSDCGGGWDEDEERSRTRSASTHSTLSSSHHTLHRSPSHNKSQTSPTSISVRHTSDLHAGRRQAPKKDNAPKGYISLTDSDSEAEEGSSPVKKTANKMITLHDDDYYDSPAPRRSTRPVVEDNVQFSDEEFPELIQQARERERQKLQQKLDAAKAFNEQDHGASASGIPTESMDDIFDSGLTTTVDSDPTIEILITSKMEGMVPLKVRRKLSQRLKEVRLSWCDKQTKDGQPLDQQTKNLIFLTWKKIRLFDATTCKTLGLNIDGRGNPSGYGDGIDSEGRIHMEAWTEDAFEVYEKRRVAKQKREQGGSDGEAAVQEEKEDTVQKIKLIMKARNMEDYKITVKATTTIERMIGAFRLARHVPDEKRIAVHFEGDELHPATVIADTELGEMDLVEVHIR